VSIPGVRLASVRRKTGGRIHLTPRVPRSGPVSTLCGQSLAAGTFTEVDAKADCTNCIRRSRDASRISSAFFEQEEGSQLLRLSIEQARLRRPAPQATPALSIVKPKAPPKPATPAIPERMGELVTSGFRPAGNGVWRSPAGVVVRMGKQPKPLFAELVYEGHTIATRDERGFTLRAGDVEVVPIGRGVEVRIRRS
jgi:hypothetical protein